MNQPLEFEKSIIEIEDQIKKLKSVSTAPRLDISNEVKMLTKKLENISNKFYGKLSSWDRVQISRHPQRPHAIDYVNEILDDFREIHGDRAYSDDQSLICGFGYINGEKIAVVGIEKGRKTNEKIKRNFGMPKPEGYRKALRTMKLASKFNIPVLTLIDTPGAYPGIEAEERGQAWAIADNLVEMFKLEVPVISVVIGEGGSGGALGIAIADKVLMMEYATYSVISPESCASILWADPAKAPIAANALQLGPQMAYKLKIVDDIIKEPIGGAHKNPSQSTENVKEAIIKHLQILKKESIEKLMEARFSKFRKSGNISLK